MAKILKRKYPTDDSDSRNRTRGTDEILTGTPKRRVDIVYKTQKDEDGYPTGYSTRTKTVTRFNRGPEGLESKVVRSKTKKVSDRRTSSTDPYAPSVQKKGGAIKKYQTEGEVSKSRTVTKGPLGLTKTIVKTKTSPGKAPVTTTKTRRTVKGVLNNVGAKFRRPPVGDYPYTPPNSKINYMPTKKKGGSLKKYQKEGSVVDILKKDAVKNSGIPTIGVKKTPAQILREKLDETSLRENINSAGRYTGKIDYAGKNREKKTPLWGGDQVINGVNIDEAKRLEKKWAERNSNKRVTFPTKKKKS